MGQIKTKYRDIITPNSEFDLDMLGVLNAYDDFNNISTLLEKNLLFMFKISVAFVKEANTLLSQCIFKRHTTVLQTFYNYNTILELKKEYDTFSNKYYHFLNEPRNYSLHYNNPSNDIKHLIGTEKTQNLDITLEVDSNNILHSDISFITYYELIKNVFNISDEELQKTIQELAAFVLILRKLLSQLTSGYFEYKLHDKI